MSPGRHSCMRPNLFISMSSIPDLVPSHPTPPSGVRLRPLLWIAAVIWLCILRRSEGSPRLFSSTILSENFLTMNGGNGFGASRRLRGRHPQRFFLQCDRDLIYKNFDAAPIHPLEIRRSPTISLAAGCQIGPVRAPADVRRTAHFHVAQRRMWP
jgi:hypothetical protein